MSSCGTTEDVAAAADDEDEEGAVIAAAISAASATDDDKEGGGGDDDDDVTPPAAPVTAPNTLHKMTPGIATRQHQMIMRRFFLVLNPLGMRRALGVARLPPGDKSSSVSSISAGGANGGACGGRVTLLG